MTMRLAVLGSTGGTRVRLTIAAALLLAFGGALALAAHGWTWAWRALIIVALAVGMFEWARLLGLSRVWSAAYGAPFSLGIVLLYLGDVYPHLFPDISDLVYIFAQDIRGLIARFFYAQYIFFWVAWVFMLLSCTLLFPHSSGSRRAARGIWGVGGLWVLPPVAATMSWAPWSLVLFLMLTATATDATAFLAGRRFGRRLLVPRISLGKTWLGLGAGLAAAGVVGATLPPLLALADTTPRVHWERVGLGDGLLLGLAVGACVVVGDLAVSALKRSAGAKDSGQLLPGPGGALDRISGFLLAAPAFAAMLFYGWPADSLFYGLPINPSFR